MFSWLWNFKIDRVNVLECYFNLKWNFNEKKSKALSTRTHLWCLAALAEELCVMKIGRFHSNRNRVIYKIIDSTCFIIRSHCPSMKTSWWRNQGTREFCSKHFCPFWKKMFSRLSPLFFSKTFSGFASGNLQS
jgi:hypothetical protein